MDFSLRARAGKSADVPFRFTATALYAYIWKDVYHICSTLRERLRYDKYHAGVAQDVVYAQYLWPQLLLKMDLISMKYEEVLPICLLTNKKLKEQRRVTRRFA